LTSKLDFFSECTPDEINKVIVALKNSSSGDDIAVKMLKLGTNYLSVIISRLINICINTGSYPDLLKVAKIIPIHKSDKKCLISNYRPISILSNLNKIFEKVAYQRLSSFVESQNILSSCQFGFRKGVSTETAMLQLVHHIIPAFEKRCFALCIFLDFSKAFDTVNHDLLLSKLDLCGVRGLAHDIFKSYLNNRFQFVNYKNVTSELSRISVGVPQGSCIGPLLYSIYSNDLPRFIDNDINKVLYADDTTLIAVSNDLADLEHNFNDVLSSLWEWCKFNRLSLNVAKNKAMLFSNRLGNVPQVHINNTPIDYVNNFKYLGVFFDTKLKYNDQLDYLFGRLSKYCGITYRIRDYLNIDSARSFYYAFFYSTVSYCITVWGGVLLCSRKGYRLERLQRRIVKNLFSKFYTEYSYTQLLLKFELLELKDIYRLRIGLLMFDVLRKNLYPNLLACISPHVAEHDYGTRHSDNFVLPFPTVESVRASFKYQCINIWNAIPREICSETDSRIFKNKYRGYLLGFYG
jgi:hypothetical protein